MTEILERRAAEANPIRPEDYQQDGLWYCGHCRTPSSAASAPGEDPGPQLSVRLRRAAVSCGTGGGQGQGGTDAGRGIPAVGHL